MILILTEVVKMEQLCFFLEVNFLNIDVIVLIVLSTIFGIWMIFT
jgi:hypothetical protein